MLISSLYKFISMAVTRKWVVYTKEESDTGEEIALKGWHAALFGSSLIYITLVQFFGEKALSFEDLSFRLVISTLIFAISFYMATMGVLAIEHKTVVLRNYLVRGRKAVWVGWFLCCSAVILTFATTVFLFRG